MSLHTSLQERLYNYLNPICTYAGINTIIMDYENGVEESGDFVAVDIKAITTDGKPEVVYKPIEGSVDNENYEQVNYRGTVNFAIDVYADEAIYKAELMKIGMAREWAKEEAMKLNIGLVNYSDTVNLTAVQEGKFRQRAQVLVNINFVNIISDADTTIGTVQVLGDIDDGKCLIDETITE